MTALLGLGARLRLARLYLVTDARTDSGDLAEFLAAAFRGGVGIVQLASAGLKDRQLDQAVQLARAAAEPYQGLVVVHASAESGPAEADLLHLSQQDGPAAAARRKVHRYALIGRTCHSRADVDAAITDPDTDYFSVGPIHPTPGAPGRRAVGLDLVRYAARVAPVADPKSKPWFPIGGIDAETIDEVIEAGARRVAVVRAITRADDPEAAARGLSRRLRQAWRADPVMEAYTLAAAAWTGPNR
ncbi:thiamine phosphate synthase [Microlunatus speluncae]|uniref:thiamine phosphate synthase n=1 Tax=Microlunatus speluncae TaxID=2594267 RepID=UPI001FED289C|nr:thiamine phosphate synthase [Microlunatus speluncae]